MQLSCARLIRKIKTTKCFRASLSFYIIGAFLPPPAHPASFGHPQLSPKLYPLLLSPFFPLVLLQSEYHLYLLQNVSSEAKSATRFRNKIQYVMQVLFRARPSGQCCSSAACHSGSVLYSRALGCHPQCTVVHPISAHRRCTGFESIYIAGRA